MIQPDSSRGYGMWTAVVVIAASIPFVTSGFVTFQLTLVLIHAVAILGLNLLTGFNGQFSLGQGAFVGIGAYVTAVVIEHAGFGYAPAIVLTAVACFAAGYAFGRPARRLAPVYLALATFALAIATPQILKLSPLGRWTGGAQGMVVTTAAVPFGLPLTSGQWHYFLALGSLVLGLVVANNLLRSGVGRAIVAIREDVPAAQAAGIDVARCKAGMFGLGAAYAGVAGGLSAVTIGFVAPESFPVALSIALLVGLVVGGVAWLPGCLIGGVFITMVPNLAEAVSKDLPAAVYGLVLLILVYLMPEGAGGLYRRLQARRRRA